jgi:transposase
MLKLPDLKIAYWYPRPVALKTGKKELAQLCKEEMGIDPASGCGFFFINPRKDRLRLFFIDSTGSKEITKFVPQKGFSVPIYDRNEKRMKVDASDLRPFFESP